MIHNLRKKMRNFVIKWEQRVNDHKTTRPQNYKRYFTPSKALNSTDKLYNIRFIAGATRQFK